VGQLQDLSGKLRLVADRANRLTKHLFGSFQRVGGFNGDGSIEGKR
jgi:hypothetical protein